MPRKSTWLLVTITVIIVAGKSMDSAVCRNLRCEHNSPCMTTYTKGDNGSVLTRERCICSGSYYGPHCRKKLRIRSVTTTSEKVRVAVLCNNVSCAEEFRESKNVLEYSLQYWSNNATFSCSVKSFSRTDIAILEDLLSESEYTVCVSTDVLDWCTPQNSATNTSDECVTFRTGTFAQYYYSVSHTVTFLVIVVSAAVGLAVLVLVFLIICKRKSLCQNYAKLSSQRKPKPDIEFSLMLSDNHRVTPPPPSIHAPSSPGRPQHKVSKRSTGFASFTARNKRTITLKSVIEYQNEDADLETTNMIETEDAS